MNCDDLKGLTYDYLERRLSPERRAEVDAHAQSCSPCGDFLTVAGELTCEELTEFLNDYVEGTLPPVRRAVFERHLGLCPPCIRYLESYKRTIELCGEALSPCDEPEEIPEGLIRAILAARKQGPGKLEA